MWTLIADYGDSSGRYRIEVTPDMTRMRTTWGDGPLGGDAAVQLMRRAPERDSAPVEERTLMTNSFALGGDALIDGTHDGDCLYIDGLAYVVWFD